ncbi:hypothetical protein I3842_13G106500 [Carya illinoinensis]|uniref:Uncharacterized protein n=1 Tax=Carya illinoinensis TaxID=32201 RepID=A0A922ALR5_CARIL|nr:hypothetical protein I3842_Q077500 [Carya illinoinensis]KAG6681741.1 hypothetical protein I3842_13G106500 [Carya illinoinensis]
MDRLMTMKYDGSSGIREYIMKMIHISSKLEALKISIPEPFLFNQLKVAYNTQRDKWDLNDLIVVCAQEKCRMYRETVEIVQLAFQSQQNKGSSHNYKSKFGGQTSSGPKEAVMKNDQCTFCKKKGHWQKYCFKFKVWLEKKKKKKNSSGTSLALVCFESSLVDVPLNSWWIDSSASIHITNSLQWFISKRRPSENEVSLCVWNGVQVKVEFIGVSLVLLIWRRKGLQFVNHLLCCGTRD